MPRHSEQDRQDHTRLKAEGRVHVRRLRMLPAEAVKLGKILGAVQDRRLYLLDRHTNILKWAWATYKIRRTQTKKYLKLGAELSPQEVRGKLVTVDSLYEVALAPMEIRRCLLKGAGAGRPEAAIRGDRQAAEAVLSRQATGLPPDPTDPEALTRAAEAAILARVKGQVERPVVDPARTLTSHLARALLSFGKVPAPRSSGPGGPQGPEAPGRRLGRPGASLAGRGTRSNRADLKLAHGASSSRPYLAVGATKESYDGGVPFMTPVAKNAVRLAPTFFLVISDWGRVNCAIVSLKSALTWSLVRPILRMRMS